VKYAAETGRYTSLPRDLRDIAAHSVVRLSAVSTLRLPIL
jgi:hypothetical protein